MAIEFDPSDDLAGVTDGLVAVTVTRPGSSTSTEVAHALRRAVRTREAEKSEGRYTAGDATWHLPASELTFAPRPGDVIVDGDSERWTVLDVQHTALGDRWRCVARNLAVVHGLDEYVDVEQATYAKGDGGADEPAWHTWKTGLRARIQPARVLVKEEHEQQTAAAEFKVFVAEDLAVDHTHRIKGSDGTRYRVTGCRKADRIDALTEIEARRVS
ncbi:MAG: hypothetical protein ABIK89_06960 [Planctomycetota bacterium]